MAVFTVNGQKVEPTGNQKLLRFLRDELHLTSVKDGCSEGACGACTVIIDGKTCKACVPDTDLLDGRTVITVEGLTEWEREVYTYAYGKAGAVQCGFCIPGMVMCTKALLDVNKEPTDDEIKYALRNNYCRCTGYVKIMDAVRLAAKVLKTGVIPDDLDPDWNIGHRVSRVDVEANSLRGIVNGLDYNEFNPETDPYITKTYNATTFRKEKVKNKLQLQRDLGLQEDPKTMMIGIVSRLTDQKGFDLIAYVMDELCQDAIQLVILGTGDERYENMFRHFDWKYHGKVSAQIYYDEKMSHRIYASADAFLMPSLFEPCGLSQLMSLRYGTLPIVRETGGLKDTVVPYNEYEGTGNGFSFRNYNAHEMLATVRNAERIYYDKKREWNKMVDRAMAADFSWGNSARQYEEMYNWLIGDK